MSWVFVGEGEHLLPLDFYKTPEFKKEGSIPNIDTRN
jgi:hypothetical protein